MKQSRAETIVTRLLASVAELQFGIVAVSLKVHSGRIVDVTYTVTESMRETEPDISGANHISQEA